MKKIITTPINLTINIFVILLPFAIINIYYPIFNLLFRRSKLFFMADITPEHKKDIDSTIGYFATKFEVEDKKRFHETINQLSKLDITYSYMLEDKRYCYQHVRYVFRIIELARDGLDSLSKINKDNKAVAYYENTKNSSIDKLIEEFTKELSENGHKKKYLKQSINEIRLKRLLAHMKKPSSRLFFNFYLTIFTFYPIENIKIPKKDKDAFELTKSMFDFLSLGYATPGQIKKSVAIQIYYLYKDKINRSELLSIIGDLIDLCFQTKTPYTNFNNIDQEPYIDNLVGKFPVFVCNNDLSSRQLNKVKRFFIHKSPFLPSYIPLSLKKYLVNKFVTRPIEYYQKNAILTFFGLFSAKV